MRQLAPSLRGSGDSRRRWIRRVASRGGGFSVAFAFLCLLPELEEAGAAIAGAVDDALAFAAHEAYLIALAGLMTLDGLEHVARRAEDTMTRVVKVETAVFACDDAVVGLVPWQRAADGVADLVTFTVAVGVHFLVIDWGLARRHRRQYERRAPAAQRHRPRRVGHGRGRLRARAPARVRHPAPASRAVRGTPRSRARPPR